MDHLLAIDQGTTGTKVLVMNTRLKIVAEATFGFKQYYPKPGWVEHDLEEIWKTVLKGIQATVTRKKIKKISAIGITNQRETVCFWDRDTAKPLGKAIVWQDRRTAEACDRLRREGLEPLFQKSTGLLLDPYFSGTKVSWALQNWPSVKKAYDQGKLCVGTIDSYLIARLSGGKAHVTDTSNASRTLCFNIHSLKWDDELCARLGISKKIWPQVRPSFGEFGKTLKVPGILDGVPITGVLGDQQSALLGQAGIQVGTAKCTYGTGAFLLMNTGKEPVASRHRLLTTIAWSFSDREVTYALEGSAFVAGAAVQWVRDGLGLVKKAEDIEKLALKVKSTDGVTFVPSLTGLGAPYWNPHARGVLAGLTRGTGPSHIARAVLEGIAFQNADILISMQKDLGKPLSGLRVDGGACKNNLLMQIQADLLGVELTRPKMTETTSLGAVFAAGVGAGIWKDLHEVEKVWKMEKMFKSKMDSVWRATEMKRWHHAVGQVNFS